MAFAHVEEQIHDRNVKGMPIATLREEKVRLQKRIAVLQEKACSGAAAEDTVNRLRCGIDYECYQMQPGCRRVASEEAARLKESLNLSSLFKDTTQRSFLGLKSYLTPNNS
ncbi:hypothetical protein F441_14310 [Phytophthora nicotianae CJ01A1]|uniref:Uncharacterized protein n=6 Tax=Phytophthora nicotianae TaxID=4792 RepID=W2PUR9_PHYN3|nr:hypothetical protein PPTG_23574 [Phytophthora nicotianae INRA-310]ETL33595.1 hypothetical protein L916_13975 [Phytophthora nicotianae]ETO68847.1 hypothetical protein F444_14431 [Phytophthora nicotianae P1976]ETP09960.1 hypothetical protein F441_14310 [Phytophthora nicotianae CJ01A1]ETP37993.1 hypothetical protein F442_14275 [Phytophthora nicotianae P10297]ETN04682.1 hypothetical protein PPTG_23574 [Phytophthora nicotianae INRA-310]